MDTPSTVLTANEEDFEICTNHDFIYKHHRGLYLDAAPTCTHPAGLDPEDALWSRCHWLGMSISSRI
jgi:hypothetical protein